MAYHGEKVITPEYVESRLIDGGLVHEILGDREMAWLRSADRSHMPPSLREASKMEGMDNWSEDTGVDGRPPIPTSNDLTKRRIDMASECIDWMKYAGYQERRIIAYVIRFKMAGGVYPPWGRFRINLMAWAVSPDALRKRYKRGLNQISDALNVEHMNRRAG